MIVIADGGSTKCDWVFLEENAQVRSQTQTIGFNPNIMDSNFMPDELLKDPVILQERLTIKHLFFYGSGCGVPENRKKIQTAIGEVFPNAKIVVKEDLTAAAYAAYKGEPAIVCILGTGSNSCYFDGVSIRRDLPSLGFLIGDEGSGNALGKLLLKHYFMKKMPEDLREEFAKEFKLDLETVIKRLYHSPRANAYLADFSTFIISRKKHPYLQHLVYEELKNFLEYQVLPYEESKTCEVNFVGSIAYYYEDILKAAAADLHLRIGKIVQKPIESLLDYHKEYLLPNLN